MRTYAMSFRETMELPMKAFWHISGNVPRIQAGERLMEIQNLLAPNQESDELTSFLEEVARQAPDPIIYTARAVMQAAAQPDATAFSDLRSLAG